MEYLTSDIECIVERAHEDKNAGHLGYENYDFYFRRGRADLQRANGIDDETLKEQGYFLVVRDRETKYLGEVFVGQKVAIRSRVQRFSPAVVVIEQEMISDGKVVAREITENCFAKRDEKRKLFIARLPRDFPGVNRPA